MNNKENNISNIKNLLVVDDDQRIRDLLKEYLIKEGFIISTADCAENAREKMKYVAYDLIILDV
ncbi:MAG: response regulator, partial [Hyphomicrobiales bacterium]|nr:response regulator [Hyphomicrobiales bacterium]